MKPKKMGPSGEASGFLVELSIGPVSLLLHPVTAKLCPVLVIIYEVVVLLIHHSVYNNKPAAQQCRPSLSSAKKQINVVSCYIVIII